MATIDKDKEDIIKGNKIFHETINSVLEYIRHNCGTYSSQFESAKKIVSYFTTAEKENEFMFSVVDKDGNISYAAKSTAKFNIKQRTIISIRKFVRRNMKITINSIRDYELDFFGKAFISRLAFYFAENFDKEIKFVSGKDLVKAYAESKAHSCMTGKTRSKKINFYGLNPEKVQLLIYKNTVRALFWTCDDGTKVLDRVYPSGCDASYLLQEWARSKGYIYRNESGNLMKNGYIEKNSFKITMKHDWVFPYVDTFYFARFILGKKEVIISNNNNYCGSSLNVGTIRTTTGWMNASLTCWSCKKEFYSNDSKIVNGSLFCRTCFNKEFFTCVKCKKVSTIKDKHLANCGHCFICTKCFENKSETKIKVGRAKRKVSVEILGAAQDPMYNEMAREIEVITPVG